MAIPANVLEPLGCLRRNYARAVAALVWSNSPDSTNRRSTESTSESINLGFATSESAIRLSTWSPEGVRSKYSTAAEVFMT